MMDHAMMFGDAPASNWAMRLSGLIAYLVATIVNALEPESTVVRIAFRLIKWAHSTGEITNPRLLHSFVSCFIDDFCM